MAFVRFPMTDSFTLKDYYRDKVLNGTFNVELPMTIYSSRITINEGGKVCIDTTNRKGYFYIDMTMLVSSVSNDWRSLGTFGSTLSNYLPKSTSNNRSTYISLIADDSSDHKPCCRVGYASSSSTTSFACGYAETFAINDRIIVYGSWSY